MIIVYSFVSSLAKMLPKTCLGIGQLTPPALDIIGESKLISSGDASVANPREISLLIGS